MSEPQHCRDIIARAVDAFGRIDILVNNAAYQMNRESLETIPDDEWDRTFQTNISAMFHLCKAALPHMASVSSIIGSSSVNSDSPSPTVGAVRRHQGRDRELTASLAQMLGERGIRVNSVAPGPIWTPLIPATMPEEKVANFGGDTPLGRPGQPVELAPVYVLLASDEGSYVSGARIAVPEDDRSCEPARQIMSRPGGTSSTRVATRANASSSSSRSLIARPASSA